mmetsp:Transcript_47509/g.148642  ORF Transcript_47509/g.148642 Transcript_47509/m.148642 type:complete len:87 (+) Transcript_47509:230-490(+)
MQVLQENSGESGEVFLKAPKKSAQNSPRIALRSIQLSHVQNRTTFVPELSGHEVARRSEDLPRVVHFVNPHTTNQPLFSVKVILAT